MGTFEQFTASSEGVAGWFNRESAAVWDSLLAFQGRSAIPGDLLEIGVFHGKSALLAALHARNDERCVLVDAVIRKEARDNVARVKPDNVSYVQARSGQLRSSKVLFERGSEGFRWIHIDGSHTRQHVAGDLALADQLLAEHGVAVVDDFLSASYPQVTAAVFDHLAVHPGRLGLFLCGFNKGYLTRPLAFPRYMKHVATDLMADLKRNGVADVMLCKTTHPDDMNCFGLTPRWADRDFRGPDWDEDLLLY